MWWTREQLKTNAKDRLRFYYWNGVVVCLIAGFLTNMTTRSNSIVEANFRIHSDTPYSFHIPPYAMTAFLSAATIIALVAILIDVFVGQVVAVGLNRYFMASREYRAPIGALFDGFRGNYLNVVKVQFLTKLSIFLWSLLFVIPGIIKTYQYYFVPYLLAENPDMEPWRAKELSRMMTDGEKWNIFVLELSFFGWYLLAAFTCGIGYFFLSPYVQATFAELYEATRERAISQGMSNPQELPGFSQSL